jgi:ubiquinone/menaquinone biosynthesis C-methylase UbiE
MRLFIILRNVMGKKVEKSKVIKVFTDVQAHRLMTDLIRKHSTNKRDVRKVAVSELKLSDCKDILDLGCGYGFFTEMMKGRVHPHALATGVDLVSGYERPFLENCAKAGIQGKFLSGSASLIKKFPAGKFDLILCSYALYFFPDLIPVISRLLSQNGIFVVITHDRNNMKEMVSVTKDVLAKNSMLKGRELPLEKIISEFSSENGLNMLTPCFGQVRAIDYFNTLVFRPEDRKEITEYFLFKSPFLLSESDNDTEWVVKSLSIQFQKASFLQDGFTISKNDRIFICSSPLSGCADP